MVLFSYDLNLDQHLLAAIGLKINMMTFAKPALVKTMIMMILTVVMIDVFTCVLVTVFL